MLLIRVNDDGMAGRAVGPGAAVIERLHPRKGVADCIAIMPVLIVGMTGKVGLDTLQARLDGANLIQSPGENSHDRSRRGRPLPFKIESMGPDTSLPFGKANVRYQNCDYSAPRPATLAEIERDRLSDERNRRRIAEIIGEPYQDAAGNIYHSLSVQPVIVLAADMPVICGIHRRALERQSPCPLHRGDVRDRP